VVVAAVDQRHLHRRLAQRPGGEQAAEAAAEDDDVGARGSGAGVHRESTEDATAGVAPKPRGGDLA
jgi:hypothetical protein